MPFTRELKSDSDIEDLLMYEIVSILQIDFAERLADNYKDQLFDYYTKQLMKHIEDKESYAVKSLYINLIESSKEEDRYQLIYDSIEDNADEFLKGILEGLSQQVETFGEMMDRINK